MALERLTRHVRTWSDGLLVYGAGSGDVHRLSAAHFELLTDIDRHPISLDRITFYRNVPLVDNQAELDDEELLDIVNVYREQFAQAGLLN